MTKANKSGILRAVYRDGGRGLSMTVNFNQSLCQGGTYELKHRGDNDGRPCTFPDNCCGPLTDRQFSIIDNLSRIIDERYGADYSESSVDTHVRIVNNLLRAGVDRDTIKLASIGNVARLIIWGDTVSYQINRYSIYVTNRWYEPSWHYDQDCDFTSFQNVVIKATAECVAALLADAVREAMSMSRVVLANDEDDRECGGGCTLAVSPEAFVANGEYFSYTPYPTAPAFKSAKLRDYRGSHDLADSDNDTMADIDAMLDGLASKLMTIHGVENIAWSQAIGDNDYRVVRGLMPQDYKRGQMMEISIGDAFKRENVKAKIGRVVDRYNAKHADSPAIKLW